MFTSKKKELIIHIGTHKTGTTSIQSWFYQNKQLLLKHGFDYPHLGVPPNNPGHHFLAEAINSKPPMKKKAKELLSYLKNSKSKKVILSSELFSVIDPKLLQNFFDKKLFKVKIICFLRRQDDFLESMFRELKKSSFYPGSSLEFYQDVKENKDLVIYTNNINHFRGRLPYYYDKFLDNWHNVFGKGNVKAILYDDTTLGTNSLEKIRKLLDLPEGKVIKSKNSSMQPAILQYREYIDRHLPWDFKMKMRPLIWKVDNQLKLNDKTEAFYDTSDRKAMMSELLNSNLNLFNNYIGSKNVAWDDLSTIAEKNKVQKLCQEDSASITSFIINELMEVPKNETSKNLTTTKLQNAQQPSQTFDNKIETFGLNFAQIDLLLNNPHALKKYLESIYELNIKTIRIPFYWRHLLHYKDDTVIPNEDLIKKYFTFVKLLPDDINILGCIVNGSPYVAQKYLHNRESLRQYYSEYLEFVIKTFDFVDDIELWNEPNASDFYFSRIDEKGHRPWSAIEFVEDIIIPGCNVLKKNSFKGKIVGVTFAENGLVGHNKPAAFSNILKGIKKYEKEFQTNIEHGSFYFIPNFAKNVVGELQKKFGTQLPFDVFGVHPYPYFKLDNKKLHEHSVELVNDFLQLLKNNKLGDTPVWATEVGVRSIDLTNGYVQDYSEQEKFVEEFYKGMNQSNGLERIYWYKFQDTNWDLIQEKTFGIFDYNYNKKQAYYILKHLNMKHKNGVETLCDDFEFSSVYNKALDEKFWKIKKNTPYAYIISSRNSNNKSNILISSGRKNNDFIAMETMQYLKSSDEGFYINIDMNLFSDSINKPYVYEISFQVSSLAEKENPYVITIVLDNMKKTIFTKGVNKQLQINPDEIKSLSLRVQKGKVVLQAIDNTLKEYQIEFTKKKNFYNANRRVKSSLTFKQLKGPQVFLEVSKFQFTRKNKLQG